MLTILIWLGSGFAFAAGFCAGLWFFTLTVRRQTDNTAKQDVANDLLRERNDIGRRHAVALERMAKTLEEQPS